MDAIELELGYGYDSDVYIYIYIYVCVCMWHGFGGYLAISAMIHGDDLSIFKQKIKPQEVGCFRNTTSCEQDHSGASQCCLLSGIWKSGPWCEMNGYKIRICKCI